MPVEPREARRVNHVQSAPEVRTEGPARGYARLDWIRLASERRRKGMPRFSNLMHHFNLHNLREAFRELDGSRASGIDGVTKKQYQENLEANLEALYQAIRGGGWRPRPSREILIPKPQGGFRPLAIGCLEDKIVQTLMSRILEAIYEPHFHRHSYGFRRGKSAHQAVGRLYSVINQRQNNCVVVEMDIEKFYNSMNHEWLMQKLELSIEDKHLLRLIRRMLRNSILNEGGTLAVNELGTPQGSPVSPVLSNIYLHYLLDEWFEQNHAESGEMVRYADDAVFVFKNEDDAQNFQAALVARMEDGFLKLNLDKSGIVPFSANKPKGTVAFLGFELFWGIAQKTLRTLKLKTSSKKMNRCMKTLTDWIKQIRNKEKLKTIWSTAAAKLRGHFSYFGVIFNQQKLAQFYWTSIGSLFKWLNRRSQKRSFTWAQFKRKLQFEPLPKPPPGPELIDITSEYRTERKHQPKSRMREICKSGSVRRGAGFAPVPLT